MYIFFQLIIIFNKKIDLTYNVIIINFIFINKMDKKEVTVIFMNK